MYIVQGESSFLPPLKSTRSYVIWFEISLSDRRYKGIFYSNFLGVARRMAHPVVFSRSRILINPSDYELPETLRKGFKKKPLNL